MPDAVNLPADALTILGHRGLGRGTVVVDGVSYVENTIASHLKAAELGVDWVELDVVATCDGQLVLRHDLLLADGREIASLSAEQAVAAGCDRLAELFAALPEHVGMYVEVKGGWRDLSLPVHLSTLGLAWAAAQRERSARPARPMLLTGFDPSLPAVVASLQRDVPVQVDTAVLLEGGTDPVLMTLAARALGARYVSAHVSSLVGARSHAQLSPRTLSDLVARAGESDVQVVCWTPDLAACAELVAAGVRMLCVDEVPMMLAALRG